MADQDKPNAPKGQSKLRQHPLLDQLMPEQSDSARAAMPQQPPNVITLSGYLAKDPEAGYWRLYSGLDLSEYYRIAEEDIVNAQLLATDDAPQRPQIVWIKATATLQQTHTNTRQVQAGFLQGVLTSGPGALGTASFQLPPPHHVGMTVGPAYCSVQVCLSVDMCKSRDFGACYTHPAACRSHNEMCPSGGMCKSYEGQCGGTVGDLCGATFECW